MEISNSILLLQSWYNNNCNGDWEHDYGIKIETLDNPGWSVEIDLVGTELESFSDFFDKEEIGDNDWIMTGIKEGRFWGSGDPSKLNLIIERFLKLSVLSD